MDWLTSEDLKEEKVGTTSIVIVSVLIVEHNVEKYQRCACRAKHSTERARKTFGQVLKRDRNCCHQASILLRSIADLGANRCVVGQ